METVTVTTKDELKEALEQNVENIIVSGDLANKLKKAKQITKLGTAGLGILTAVLRAAPITGGLSIVAAAPIAALTGLEIAAIIAASAIGISLISSVFIGYEEINWENVGGNVKMFLRKRSE